jgi:lipid A 3-O-deacylase
MGRNGSVVLTAVCILVLFAVSPVWSGTGSTVPEEKPHKWLREVGLLTGYGIASLGRGDDYEIIPILPQFGFDINPLARKLHINPRGTIEGVVEPLMNVVISPDTNAEVGCSFLLKYADHITSRIAPYIEGGFGIIYTTQHTRKQGTQYNFLSQVGVGLQFFLNEKFALTGGYRFRHMSNAGIDSPNRGINHHFALLGLSYFF